MGTHGLPENTIKDNETRRRIMQRRQIKEKNGGLQNRMGRNKTLKRMRKMPLRTSLHKYRRKKFCDTGKDMMRTREYDEAWPTCPEMKRCHECGSLTHLKCQSKMEKATRPGWKDDYEEVNTCETCQTKEEGIRDKQFEKETNQERTKRKKEERNKRRKKRKIKVMNGKMNMYGGEGPTGWETPRKGAGKGKDVRSNNQKAKARQYEEAEKWASVQ